MKKVCFVFGTRPEAIKLAPVILLCRQQTQRFQTRVCVTGQHRQMLDQMLRVFDIQPDVDLNLMRPNQTLASISGQTLQAVSEYLAGEKPDWVLVQGDTTTVWAAALAAFFNGVSVGHVEAGLRTGDKRQPFPEEVNRRIATQVADLHFAPTAWARDNLLAEGIDKSRVIVTGNTVIDALQWVLARNAQCPYEDALAISQWCDGQLGRADMVLITGHRRESFGKPFEEMCLAIAELAGRHPQIHWVYPVHLNPNVQEPVRRILGNLATVHLIDPQPYASFVWLMNRSRMILTDSGGVQEEAPSLGKPVLVMRNTTERPEGVKAGVVRLVGNAKGEIIRQCEEVLAAPPGSLPVASPYGDGKAAERILDSIHEFREDSQR
ncbi:MAG: UDP-N-acetylglucosamine 2-epimerase (non-hydrolyzing) [Phycisphaerae bacterium]|nr:UDP-N-acetylglucosamine 2-epimerase (non-hydrolyzing) [Phycisphaerae bacterium]